MRFLADDDDDAQRERLFLCCVIYLIYNIHTHRIEREKKKYGRQLRKIKE